MKSLNTRTWLAAAAACTALVGCQQRVIEPDREAGGSDEIDTRLALDAKGRPVAGARIALVKAGDSTGRLAALSSTGAEGQYPSFNVPDGAYSATLRDASDSLGKFLDTLQISGGRARVGRDTLLALGKIRGVVRLVGGETPASVILSLYGTDIAANVLKDGTFVIDLVPGGLFTLMGTTTLDGYGTLLRRLQLRDGQDLVIPDTLSLPVTGLLAPREIWAESDTGTGDVCVRWNAVDHPNRMGYVLETLENGVVIGTQFLKDTTWKDSLSAYWEGLPLLGPWPSRERVYRVRTRALNGGGDSRSVAKTLVAKAPEWTRRIDSLGMVMTTDTTKEISRFQWKPFRHPRVLEWRMQRLADGVEDCSGNPVGGAWSDSACKSATVVVIDSTIAGSPNASKVFQQKQPLLTYRLEAERRSGQPEVLFSQDKQTKVTPWLEWERVENPGFKGWKWIWGSGGRLNIARAGGSWEEVPFDCAMPQWLVLQNSVWSICSERSTNLSSFTLDGKGRWNKRTYLTDEIAYLVGGVEVDSGRPLIFGSKALHGRIRFGQIDSDRISFSDTVYPRVDMEFVEEFAEPKITPIEGWGIYLGLIPMYGQSDKILVSRLPSDGSYRRKEWIYSRSTYAGYWYGLGADSFLWLYHSSALGKSMNIYQFWDGDGYVVPEAPVTTNYSNSDWTMIDGEIYVMSWDDSSNEVFWKAKRNFPSNH